MQRNFTAVTGARAGKSAENEALLSQQRTILRARLAHSKDGSITCSVENCVLILENDPVLMGAIRKNLFTGCMVIAVIRRTGKVLAAEWHGKLTTFLLYTLMIAHVVFYNIAPALSDTLIIICTAMMCFSFLLYMMRNIRALKSVGKKTEKKPERTVQAFER